MSTPNEVNAARRRHRPVKARLGQNFLVDANAAQRIVDALGNVTHSVVIEIGPGRGALTRALAERAESLIAIEVDKMLAEHLRAAFSGNPNVEIVQENFLNVSLSDLLSSGRQSSPHQRAKVVGNIPYYITSDILLRLLEQHELVETIVLMVQKEVADRLVAQPGSRDYGLLTVTAQLYTEVERQFTLPPGAFSPPPQVHSTVLRLRVAPKAEALQLDSGRFIEFSKLAFSKKRKTLFNNLRRRYEQDQIREAMSAAQVQQDIRAEALSLEKLAKIFRWLSGSGKGY
jgi:16S rRNA (adenine1518-N6/adenine1519-N6)-dimethyltransferase